MIVVFSCDNNQDLWFPFYYCMEKYWPNHPRIVYKTERIKNPYYETISTNYPLNEWTKGIREALKDINEPILFMADDCFIRKPVDEDRIEDALELLKKPNTACVNFEKSFDENDEEVEKGFKKRSKGALYEVSVMCGLWNKDALMKVLEDDLSPWDLELLNDGKGFNFYINGGDFIIDWGYEPWQYAGIMKGKWCREAKYFFDNEGITIDYDKRGFA